MNLKRYKEVLSQLDEQSDMLKLNFPMFGAADYYVDSRMTVFADQEHWGILIEVIEESTGGTIFEFDGVTGTFRTVTFIGNSNRVVR
jgi:hypothetical protein